VDNSAASPRRTRVVHLLSTGCCGHGVGHDVFKRLLALPHEALDLVDGVDHRGVVAPTEESGDGGVTEVGELAEHVHRHLAGGDEGPLTALAPERLDAESDEAGELGEQFLVGAGLHERGGQHRPEQLFGHRNADRDPVERGVGGDPDEGPFQLTDVGGDVAGDELEDIGRHRALIALGLVAQDGQTGLEVGGLDVGDQAPPEATAQPVLERRNGIGHPVAGDDDLLAGPVQGVEGVEELLLEPFLALHELDVVDEQCVDVAVAVLEAGGRVGTDRVDVLVEERLGADVADHVVLVVALDVVADGVEQVGLAESGRAVDEQRVVAPSGHFRDTLRGRQCELVGLALHERLEGVAGVHPRRGRRGDGRRPRRRRRPAGLARNAVGRPLGDGLGLRGLDLDGQLQVRRSDLLEGVADQWQVAGEDPVAGVGVGGAHTECLLVGVDRHDVLEGGEPHRLGHLRAQQLCDGCPQLLVVVHLRFLPSAGSTSTPLSTCCGQPAGRRRHASRCGELLRTERHGAVASLVGRP